MNLPKTALQGPEQRSQTLLESLGRSDTATGFLVVSRLTVHLFCGATVAT